MYAIRLGVIGGAVCRRRLAISGDGGGDSGVRSAGGCISGSGSRVSAHRRPVDERVLCVDGGVLRRASISVLRRAALAAARRRPEGERHDGLELIAEALVHPRVQERVVDGRAHRRDVRDEEEHEEVASVLSHLMVLLRHVDHVQRQPAAHEYRHHGDEHAVRTALALDIHLLAIARLLTEFGARASPEHERDLRVAEGDDAARHDVLQDEAGDGEELAGSRLRPVLVADVRLLVLDPRDLLVYGQGEGDRH